MSVQKNENVTVPGFVKYLWYRVPGQPGSWRIGPYDFLVSVNIKPQMSIQILILYVWMNEWMNGRDTQVFLTTKTEARVTLTVFSSSAVLMRT